MGAARRENPGGRPPDPGGAADDDMAPRAGTLHGFVPVSGS